MDRSIIPESHFEEATRSVSDKRRDDVRRRSDIWRPDDLRRRTDLAIRVA
jgi:hypothetical protein